MPKDAKKYFSIPSDMLEESPKGTHLLFVESQEFISEIPIETKTDTIEAQQQNPISKDLATLNKASSLFWLNADPEQKDTHTANDTVSAWLKSQGYSDISAKQGASIIRPDWAAKGRPSK